MAQTLYACLGLMIAVLTGSAAGQEVEPSGPDTEAMLEGLLDAPRVSASALSPDGKWLVMTSARLRDRLGVDSSRTGDPTHASTTSSDIWVTDTQSGARRRLFEGRRHASGFAWSPDSQRLAMFLRDHDRNQLKVWDRDDGFLPSTWADARDIDTGSGISWSADGQRLILAVRPTGWRESAYAEFLSLTQGPIVHLSSEQPFLAWEALRRRALERVVVQFDLAAGTVADLVAEQKVSRFQVTESGSHVVYSRDITTKTDYQIIFGSSQETWVVPTDGSEARLLMAARHDGRGSRPTWSGDGMSYSYAEKGAVYFGSLNDAEPRIIAGEVEAEDAGKGEVKDEDAAADNGEADTEDEKESTLRPLRLSHDGGKLWASSKGGWWVVDTASGNRSQALEFEEDTEQRPRRSPVGFTPDGSRLIWTTAEKDRWERGVYALRVTGGTPTELQRGSTRIRGLRFAAAGGTVIYTAADNNRPADVYAADEDLSNVRRLSHARPELDDAVARAELISYRDSDGDETYGVLYYPLNHDPEQTYPTVFLVYETFFDAGYNDSIHILNAHGYAVVQPSVHLETGYPGEAWVKGVTAAANKVIDMGVADPKRLGVHGTSYGGYATNLLIAQTDRFAAAINISGKVNMVSFYTDSPRLGVRNIHAPENSQDRIGATLWEQPQKYVAHSVIMDADRINTPLLLMSGAEDHNVPARQAMEMYYALRRLGRTVEWVNYTNGGHGMPRTTVEEVKDYHGRILGWYHRYLHKPDDKKAEDSPSKEREA